MVFGYFLIDVVPGSDRSVYDQLLRQKAVLEQHMTLGLCDLLAKVESMTEGAVDTLAYQLRNVRGVKAVTVLTVTA
jgi:translation elongation factor EF-1beta